MLTMKSLATVVAAGAGLAVASSSMMPVQAFSLTEAQSSGVQKGNDITNGKDSDAGMKLLNNKDIFDVDGGWNFDAKYDGGYEGDNNLDFEVNGLNDGQGTFNFGNDEFDFTNNDLAISLKAGNGFNMYYVEAGSLSSGDTIDWDTSIDLDGKDLSHASVFVREASNQNNDDPSQSIPEPGAGMALGIVALGGVAYRKFRS